MLEEIRALANKAKEEGKEQEAIVLFSLCGAIGGNQLEWFATEVQLLTHKLLADLQKDKN